MNPTAALGSISAGSSKVQNVSVNEIDNGFLVQYTDYTTNPSYHHVHCVDLDSVKVKLLEIFGSK
jgi:hypothetical protein